MSNKADFPYLHGFSQKEQDRLRQQAAFAEHIVYKDINLSNVKNLLEVGCGVGAQSEILLRRFPKLNLTGIDLNDKQLAAATSHLESLPYADNRFNLIKMNAESLDFLIYKEIFVLTKKDVDFYLPNLNCKTNWYVRLNGSIHKNNSLQLTLCKSRQLTHMDSENKIVITLPIFTIEY